MSATSVRVLLLFLLALNLESAIRRRAGGGGLRRKVHVADLITTPGTIEAEWYNSYSSSGNYLMPSLLKVTPLTGDSLLARTEFSLGFDPIEREQMTVSALSVLTSSPKFSVAAGPQVSWSIHGEAAAHAGGFGIARWDLGAHNLGITGSYNGVLDIGAGYGVQIGRFTPHANVLWERAKSVRGFYSATEGIAFQLSKKLTIDLVGQHVGAPDGPVDHQVQCGLIYNLGKIRRH